MAGYTDEMRRQAGCFAEVYSPVMRYVNDHCFVKSDDGTYHLFHITGPAGKGCYDKNSEISFGHAVSSNLGVWTAEKDVLSIDPAFAWEKNHIFAPFVQKNKKEYFLFYAGINQETKKESMCAAISKNLYTWHKYSYNPVFRPSKYWAEYGNEAGIWSCCRDPHILEHQKLGFIMYYTAWLKGTCGQIVTIGSAVSDNLISWQDAGPVMIRGFASGHRTTSMESPCIIERNGIYYLFYKHRDGTRLVVSDDPLRFTDKKDTWFSIAHAAEIFRDGENWYISSCSRDILDLQHAATDRTRGLFLANLDWTGEIPLITPFVPPTKNP